jgi:hypothetical protein
VKFIVAFVAAAALVSNSIAAAAEPDSPFEKGTWNFSLTGSYVQPIRFSRDKFTNVNVSAGYYFWNNNSINLELQGYYDDRPDGAEAALLGGIGLLFRTHLYTRDRWTIFMDGGGSVTYADHEVPQFGTNFNFTGKFGFGAGYEIQDRTYLMAGARYFHLSNGQIRGRDDNPSYDGVQFWTGVMWTW